MSFSRMQSRSFATLGAAALAFIAPLAAHAQAQDLYVADQVANTISRFAGTGPGQFSAVPTVLPDPNKSLANPVGLAFDAAGNLFVANFNGKNILEYASTGAGTYAAPTVFLSGFSSEKIAFDAHNNLFATDYYGASIREYASTGAGTYSATPTFLTGGLNGPEDLAFDSNGSLFASNYYSGNITKFTSTASGTFGSGEIFAAREDKPGGLNVPAGLAFDAQGSLFVADFNALNIKKFASNAGTLSSTYTIFASDPYDPFGLAFDSRGDLFATDLFTGPINKYAVTDAGTLSTTSTIFSSGFQQPAFMAFAPAAVPEASTTVTFGLLLVLGVGGLAFAGKRKKTA